MSGARDAAQRVVTTVSGSSAFATQCLASEIKDARLDGRDAALATELALGVLRHRRRLDVALAGATPKGKLKVSARLRAILRIAAYELLFLDGVPVRATLDQAVKAAKRIGGPRMAGLTNAVLHRLERIGEPDLPSDLQTKVSILHSLPDWLAGRIVNEVGVSELEATARGFNRIPPVCLRPNRLRTTRAELLAEITCESPRTTITANPLVPDALICHRLGSVAKLSAFTDGHCTVQDVAAQMVGQLAHPEGVERILDACAGVGGKTTHLAERFGDTVPIDAVDISTKKLTALEQMAKRLGLHSIRMQKVDLCGRLPAFDPYNLVVLDAPCSGLGVLRRHPEAKWRLSPQDIARMVAVQRQLLNVCGDLVAPGGQLVYAVCSPLPEEGRLRVAEFLRSHSNFVPAGWMATWPHYHDADGFFAAHLIRRR